MHTPPPFRSDRAAALAIAEARGSQEIASLMKAARPQAFTLQPEGIKP